MIIGIGGASRSGKTTLANELKRRLGSQNIKIISQDDFTFRDSEIPKFHGLTDWEHPNGIDFSRLTKNIQTESKNHTHLIIEGFLIYYNKALARLIDFKLFIDIDEKTFLNRKLNDDRWGLTSITYISHIWDSYLTFGLPSKNNIDLLLDGNEPFNTDAIISQIRKSQ